MLSRTHSSLAFLKTTTFLSTLLINFVNRLKDFTIDFSKPSRHPKILFLEQNDISPGFIRKNDNLQESNRT